VENERLRRALEEIAAVDRASAREIARAALEPEGEVSSQMNEFTAEVDKCDCYPAESEEIPT
jgi:hypothetical protein